MKPPTPAVLNSTWSRKKMKLQTQSPVQFFQWPIPFPKWNTRTIQLFCFGTIGLDRFQDAVPPGWPCAPHWNRSGRCRWRTDSRCRWRRRAAERPAAAAAARPARRRGSARAARRRFGRADASATRTWPPVSVTPRRPGTSSRRPASDTPPGTKRDISSPWNVTECKILSCYTTTHVRPLERYFKKIKLMVIWADSKFTTYRNWFGQLAVLEFCLRFFSWETPRIAIHDRFRSCNAQNWLWMDIQLAKDKIFDLARTTPL